MNLKRNVITRAAVTIGTFLLLLSVNAVAQDSRSEISVQGTGFFTKDSDNNGIHNQATQSGGFLVGYRYAIRRWLAAEANYGYTRNTQSYTTGLASARVQSNVHEITGAAVATVPYFGRLRPFVLAGGGVLVFDPVNNAGVTVIGASTQTRPVRVRE